MSPDAAHPDRLAVARKIGQDTRLAQRRRQTNGAFRERLTQIEHDLRRARLPLKQKDAPSSFETLFDRDCLSDRMRLGRRRATDDQGNEKGCEKETKHGGGEALIFRDRARGAS